MGYFQGLGLRLASAFAAVTLVACHAHDESIRPEKSPSESLESVEDQGAKKYKNLISKITELGKTKKYILFGDTHHGQKAIREAAQDPAVLRALADAGFGVFIVEDGVEQNKIDHEFHLLGYLRHSGILEEYPDTPEKFDQAIGELVLAIKQDERFQWDGGNDTAYTPEFEDHVVKLIEGKKEADPDFYYYFQNLMYSLGEYFRDGITLDYMTTSATVSHLLLNGVISKEEIGKSLIGCAKESDLTDDEKKQLKTLADFIYHTSTLGIQLYAPDERHQAFGTHEDPETQKAAQLIMSAYNNTTKGYDSVLMGAYANSSNARRKGLATVCDIALMNLDKTDAVTANNIKGFVGDGKAAGLYGDAHMSKPNDFDEMLGADNCVTISIFVSPEERYYIGHPNHPYNKGMSQEDLPQYVYYISNDQLVEITPGTESENIYRRHTVDHLTEEEYDIAVSMLPDEFKPHALPYTEYDRDWGNNQRSNDWWMALDVK